MTPRAAPTRLTAQASLQERSSIVFEQRVRSLLARPEWPRYAPKQSRWTWTGHVGSRLHMRSSMGATHDTLEVMARRRCLVCDAVEDRWEPEDADEIGPECTRCHAPTERLEIVSRRSTSAAINPHAAALGRLGGLKGGPARAARLSP